MIQRLSFAAALGACLLLSANPARAQVTLPPGFPAGIQLPAKAHGDDAIAALGNRLPEVAAFYRKTPQELRALFKSDHSLWADTRGRLFYVCDLHPDEAPVTGQVVDTVAAAPFPPEMAFRLHSRPGSGRVIYLDFDGHDASTTVWGADAIARPCDFDSLPGSFSSSERTTIIYIWQRVAADYAMYDLDVTTEDPGIEALRKTSTGDTNYGIRVGIGGSSADWYGSAGGVAYVGSFDDNIDLPCWVFPGSLGNSEKNIAEACSHEVGHTLGLSHDGRISPAENYYYGQGNWAPIMGVGYNRPIVQWSKGEYASANQTQDDLAVMLNYGAAYRPDDYGNSVGTASPLTGVKFYARGRIETTADVDFFSFSTGDGPISINVSRAPRDSNLKIQVTLYNGAGVPLQTNSVPDTSAGTQPVTLTAQLAAGDYAFAVEGIGEGNVLTTGYTDYASLGEYMVVGTLPSDSTWTPTAGGAGYSWLDTANWAGNVVPRGAGSIHRFTSNLIGDETITLSSALTIGRMFVGDADASHSFVLQSAGPALSFDAQTNQAAIIKTSGTNDVLALPIVLAQNLAITNTSAGALSVTGGLSGAGSLLKVGSGLVTLGGALNHTGGTTVGEGALKLETGTTLAGAIEIKPSSMIDVTALAGGFTLSSGQQLGGAGSVSGDVLAGSGARLSPGGNGVAGTLTFSNNLVLDNGSTLQFDLAPLTTPGGNTNDLIVVSGNLTANSTVAVDVRLLSSILASPGNYTLIRYGGTLSGSAANFAAVNYTNRYAYAFDDSTPGEIRLIVSGAPASLVWKGDGSLDRWDVTGATNWLLDSAPVTFAQLDAVLFDDTGAFSPATSLLGSLTPASVSVNCTNDLTLAGSGKLSGAMALNKSGSGTLTISTSNDFTGGISVTAGTLKPANARALGATNGVTVITNGARLDVNGLNLGAEPVFVSGGGIGGTGAVINASATAQNQALRFVTLTGDTTFGGNARWDIRANPTASLSGSFNLTKTGTNEIWLADLGATQLKEVSVQQGTLAIQDTTTLGLGGNNVTVESGAALVLWNTDNNSITKKLVMNGGVLRSDAGDNIWSGTTLLNSNTTISVSSILEMQGVISGAGINKTGAGTLSLTAGNSFTGAVTVAAGTLRAGNASALGNANTGTTISSDARLDIAGFNLGAEPVTVTGDGLGNAGAIINNGAVQQNALRFVTLSGNATLGGISRWDIRANPTGSFTGNNYSLTKRGPNDIWLSNLGDSGLGNITVAEGMLTFQGTTTMGAAGSTLSVTSGGSVGFFGTGANVLSKVATLNIARVYNGGGSNVFAGSCSLSGSNAFEVAVSSALDLRGSVTGSGSIWNVSGGTLILAGANTYSGATVISAGTLQIGDGGNTGTTGTGVITNYSAIVLNRTNDFTVANLITGSGSLTKYGEGTCTFSGTNASSGAVYVQAGTLLLTGALGVNSLIVNGAGTLRGTGLVPGATTVTGAISPGMPGGLGTLRIANSLTLGGSAMFRIGKSPGPVNDALSGITTVNYGGALIVTNTGGTLALGDAFQLFSAGAYQGSFASVTLPPPGPGLVWSNRLALDGSIVVAPVVSPAIQVSLQTGTNINLSFPSEAGVNYVLQSATQIAAPIAWTSLSTNVGTGAVLDLSVPVNVGEPSRYFRLLVY